MSNRRQKKCAYSKEESSSDEDWKNELVSDHKDSPSEENENESGEDEESKASVKTVTKSATTPKWDHKTLHLVDRSKVTSFNHVSLEM
jgi:hypothetical protein